MSTMPLSPSLPPRAPRTGFGPRDRHGLYLIGSSRIVAGNSGIVYSRPGKEPFMIQVKDGQDVPPGFLVDSTMPENAPDWVKRDHKRFIYITSSDVPADDTYTYIEQ